MRSHCPVSDRQFQVAGGEQVNFKLVQDRMRTVLKDTIVVGFDIANTLKMLGISLPPEDIRDAQKHFDAERCSELDLRGKGLCALDGQRPKHSLRQSVYWVGLSRRVLTVHWWMPGPPWMYICGSDGICR